MAELCSPYTIYWCRKNPLGLRRGEQRRFLSKILDKNINALLGGRAQWEPIGSVDLVREK